MRNTFRRTISLLGVALMATQIISVANAQSLRIEGASGAFEQAAPATAAHRDVQDLLKEIASNAAIAGRHAETLQSFSRVGSQLHKQSHAAELTGAREAINAMGSDFRRLQELRSDALPWQQMVIDRVETKLAGLAGHTSEAIERLKQDRPGFPSGEYRDAVLNMYAHADQARNLIAVNMDYAEAREELNRLDAAPLVPAETALYSKATKSLEHRVRGELLSLPYYGVFDHLAFQVEGDQVALSGQVHWPTLKTDAERAVGRVEGVTAVNSTIEVLPLSPSDDRIRIAAYRAIYGHSTLAQYRLNPHPPIRIIVTNGHLTLTGFVGSEMDRTVAHMQANSVPGAFSVTNNLQVGS